MKRIALSLILLAAACGSKSPAPATPAPAAPSTGEEANEGGPYVPAECDRYCADGCAEVELTDECIADCGCPPDYQEHPAEEEDSADDE
jgi:hypothetical protein